MSEYIGLAAFLCVGLAALTLLFIPLRKLLRYLLWKRTDAVLQCTEIAYEIVSRFPMSGRMVATRGHVPKISFQYRVGNDQYESKSIVDPLEEPIWFGSEAKAQRFVASLTSSESVRVLYNPSNPNESVLINRARIGDVVGIVSGSTISPIFFYLAILLWPASVPALDFPLYPNADVYAFPDLDDDPKFWTLTTADSLDDVVEYYDASVGDGWQSNSPWQAGLPGSVFRVWTRVSESNDSSEKVTVRVVPETIYVRKGVEVSIGYYSKPVTTSTDASSK